VRVFRVRASEAGSFDFELVLAITPEHLIAQELWTEIRRFWSWPRQLVKGIPADSLASVSPTGRRGDRYISIFLVPLPV
jgi:hypothetical protein